MSTKTLPKLDALEERADSVVWHRLCKLSQPIESISDTGTVENLMERHEYTLRQIADGHISRDHLLDSICWLY